MSVVYLVRKRLKTPYLLLMLIARNFARHFVKAFIGQ
jgi:hypothetical protein